MPTVVFKELSDPESDVIFVPCALTVDVKPATLVFKVDNVAD